MIILTLTTVTNTGKVVGSEVVQLYAEFPALARTPPLQLKGFHKTRPLEPSETGNNTSNTNTTHFFTIYIYKSFETSTCQQILRRESYCRSISCFIFPYKSIKG